jgi:integrase
MQYRANRVSRRMSVNGVLNLQVARREAKAITVATAKGGDPLVEKRNAAGETLEAAAKDYLKCEAGKLRTGERVSVPSAVPIRRGMARTKQKESARNRILSDDELRAVWRAAEVFSGPYGHLVRFLLLMATRRSEATKMVRGELVGDDWIIPAARMKAKVEHVVPVSPAAKAILDGIPVIGARFVFTLDGRRPRLSTNHGAASGAAPLVSASDPERIRRPLLVFRVRG